MTIYTQAVLEAEMIDGGRERARIQMAKNEAEGRANANRYASPMMRRYIDPITYLIQQDKDSITKPGRHRAHLKLLDGLEADTVAFIAVRHVLVSLLQDPSEDRMRFHAGVIGKRVQDEQVLRQFSHADPERFWMLQRVLEKRHSQDPRHRMILALKDMAELNIDPIDWGRGNRDQVGAYLIEKMREVGLLEAWMSTQKTGKKFQKSPKIKLSLESLQLLESMRDMVEETTPYFLPCVEKPLDWEGLHGGGFHTLPMQQMAPVCVLHGNPGGGSIDKLTQALNVLQAVRWRVNAQVLDIARELARTQETKELVNATLHGLPGKPVWLTEESSKDTMSQEQLDEFKAWKRATADAHTANRVKVARFGRMKLAFHVAQKLRDQPELYFVYFADNRGRVYPYTSGISPQGSDLQKGLLEFAVGKPLGTPEAVHWFLRAGANRFGVDKVSAEDQVAWVHEHAQMLYDIGKNPLGNLGWLEADSPFQFLAWVLEYAAWRDNPEFPSRVAVGMDGSCNGLQNYSAMLRDEVGGVSTNLVPGPKPADIYQAVADATVRRVEAADDDYFKRVWVRHGVHRKAVKRSVMTLVYGSKKFSSRGFILNDYLREVESPFPAEKQAEAARWLNEHLWEAIKDVVVKAREAMDWLQHCASLILKEYSQIQWRTPTGFVVTQDYRKMEVTGHVRVQVFGGARWRISGATDIPDKISHRNSIAPNFIHSMDASHMQLTCIAAHAEGIDSLAMVHDDFGTHAADAERFSHIIRRVFVEMYEQADWLYEFAARYMEQGVMLPEPPSKGTLDIRQVLDSPYFFA